MQHWLRTLSRQSYNSCGSYRLLNIVEARRQMTPGFFVSTPMPTSLAISQSDLRLKKWTIGTHAPGNNINRATRFEPRDLRSRSAFGPKWHELPIVPRRTFVAVERGWRFRSPLRIDDTLVGHDPGPAEAFHGFYLSPFSCPLLFFIAGLAIRHDSPGSKSCK